MKLRAIKILVLLLILVFPLVGTTNAYFSDSITLSEITVTTGHWVPPVISNINYLIATPDEANEPLATITWSTDELATSNLRWSNNGGTTWINLPEDIVADNTSHSLEITGLITTTTYNYKVRSKDQAGNETISSSYSFTTGGGDTSDFVATTDVVINEFLPNPIGADNAAMPGGEWVELYNKSATTSYNLTGWYIKAYAISPSYKYKLTTTNTVSSDPSTTGLTIGPLEFFVVYRNGNVTFQMENAVNDRIRLYNASNVLVDRFMYTASQVIENKSIARYPDGSDTWFDPVPTPGGPNRLEAAPVDNEIHLDFSSSDNKKSVGFKVYGDTLSQYDSLEYVITYDSEQGEQGVKGTKNIEGKNEILVDDILLGSCSSGGTCVYHSGVTKVTLEVILKGPVEQTLSKELFL